LREPLLLLLAALLVYGACLTAPFQFDDHAILSDRAITSAGGWREVWDPLQTRPLTYFTFWVNHRIGGRNPAGYHAVNLALHLVAVWLLWDVLSRRIPRRPALVASALFALHPIQSEPVLYVFARGTLLMAVFCLLSFRAWTLGKRWQAVAWFAAALLAKEECVAFPLFLLLLYFSGSRNAAELRAIGAMLGLSLLAGLRVLFATVVQPGAAAGPQAGIAPWDYLVAQGVVILRYFRLALLPWGFTVDPDVGVPSLWVGLAAWAGVLGLAVLAFRRFDRLREGFWFLSGLVLLLPSSSIFPAADLAADRRMYLPMVAFGAAAGFVLRAVRWRWLAPAAVLLAALSVGRTQVWRSAEALWDEAARRAPDKVRPKVQLARARGPKRGLPLLDEARRLAPEDAPLAAELGKTYLLLGDGDRALAEFGRALALRPGDAQALNNRGVALMSLGQFEAARQDFERALQVNPCLFDARFNLHRLGARAKENPSCRFSDEQRRLLGL
jgi:tetratricopeptide (TPR) repeat protein